MTAPIPKRECATCGAVRPIHELVSIVDPDTEQDAWHCRDCVKAGTVSTGIGPLDAWLGSVLDGNVRAAQQRKDNPA